VAALAAGLAARGHDVTVYTRRDGSSVADRVVTDEGYVVEHVSAGPAVELPKDDLLPHMTELGDRLRERWREEPPDVVHAHFWMSGLACLRATRDLEVPVVQTFHALGSVKRRQQGLADTSPRTRIDEERRLCREVDHVIATCHDEVRELSALGLPPVRVSVIPCGVDTDLFRPGLRRDPGGPPRLLVVGRLVTRKGVGTAIESLVELPGVELVVAGGPGPDALDTDPEVARLRGLAAQAGVLDRVRFVGGVGRHDVPGLIRDCDIVVTVPWYEPFGIVPLEAMACGRPIIGAAVGGLLDTVVPGVTGELVDARSPGELARCVRDLLAAPERRAEYGAAGRRRAVERYDWAQISARTEEVLAAVVADRFDATAEVAP
jgi:glycosyltransferase involved in cell wall biosynthesis